MASPRRPESAAAFPTRRLVRRCGAFASLLLACTLAAAQSPTDGALHGTFRDASQRPASGATVLLRSLDDAEVQGGPVLPDGSFLLPHLPPGSYSLSVTLLGRELGRFEPVAVNPGETLELRLTLGSPAKLTLAAPDQPATPLPDEDDDGLRSVDGLTPMQNGSFLDGLQTTQSYSAVPVGSGADPAPDPDGDPDSAERSSGSANGLGRGRHAGIAYAFSQLSVREFRLSGHSYSTQSGRAGELASMVSRSGSSQLHGSAFFTLRSQAFAASSPLAIATTYSNGVVASAEVKPHDLRTSFGAALGGPVPGLSNFVYFYSFDQQRRGFPAISSPADPNFYVLTAQQTALLANRGVTHAQVVAALNFLSSLTGETPRSANQTLNFVRFDWRAPRHNTLALEYNAARWHSPAGLIDAPVVARGRASLGNAAGSLDLLGLRLASTPSANISNHARFAFLHDLQYETPQTPLPQEPAIAPGGLAPQVNIAPNGLLFGTPASLSQTAFPDERRLEAADTLTLLRGHHLVEIGAVVSFLDDRVAALANTAGTFTYDSTAAGGLVDFITDQTFNVNTNPNGGCPSINAAVHLFCFRSFTQSFGQPSIAFSTQEWAGFAEDTWRPHPRLSVHLGARYEYTLLPIPFTPNPALDAVFGSRGASNIFPEDRNNLGPRAALAYEPFGAGRGLIRLGFGAFFGRLPGATLRAALTDTAQPSTSTRIRIRPTASIVCPQVPAQGFGYPCDFLAQPPGAVAVTSSAVVFDRRFRLPVVEQASLTLERSLFHNTELRALYTLNLDRQLPGSTDLNIAPSTVTRIFQLHGGTGAPGVQDGETFRVPFYTARLSPSFGPVTDIVSNVNATYNGVELSAQSRPLPGLRLRASYTRSKAIDLGQTLSATPRTNAQFDPFQHGFDKGLSALDFPWALRADAVWTPAVEAGPKALRRLVNGWDFTPIVSARSGRPYSLDLSGGPFLPGGHASLNGSGGALYLPTVGRNTLRLPPTVNVDLRVARAFEPHSGLRLQAAAEAFNLLNHRNVSSVNQRAFLVGTAVAGVTPLVFQSASAIAAEGLNTLPFGTPTAASTSLTRERQLQFTLRLQF